MLISRYQLYPHERFERHREEPTSRYGTGACGSHYHHENGISDASVVLMRQDFPIDIVRRIPDRTTLV